MDDLNTFQKYFVEEFYDDYRDGLLSRRAFIRRVAFITGSMAATVSVMTALGCQPIELPAPSEPMPEPVTPTSEPEAAALQLEPVPDAKSPFSVPEGDPDVEASDVTFTSQGDEIMAYLARPAADGVYAGILVCHENRGLNPHIRDVARRFAKAGYVALAIDLLSCEGGTAANDPDQVPGLLSNAGTERHVTDFAAGLKYLQGLDYVGAYHPSTGSGHRDAGTCQPNTDRYTNTHSHTDAHRRWRRPGLRLGAWAQSGHLCHRHHERWSSHSADGPPRRGSVAGLVPRRHTYRLHLAPQ